MGLIITAFISQIWQRLKAQIFAERIGSERFTCGMTEHIEDERDLQYGWVFGAPNYQPKNKVVDIKTISIKNQGSASNCVFQSATVQKECDEGVELSARFLTTEAKKRGRVSGNGFSSLRQGQQTLIDVGTCKQDMLLEDEQNWNDYSDASKLSYCAELDADQRKNKSFASVTSRDEWLHALDNGRPIHTGMPWFTSYNSSGGLTAPYILTLGKGINVGGHAFVCTGFDLNRNVYQFQNSYSENYGDRGKFYVYVNDWHKMGYVGYVSVDAGGMNPSSKFYEGKDVKADGGPKIYRIEDGKKRHYPDEATFKFFGGVFSPPSYTRIAGSLLNSIPDGENMTTNIKP